MIFLYPDKAYHDEIGFNYYPDLIVVTTKVIDGVQNPDLKPITNTKLEAGIDFNIHGVKVMLTAFDEKIKNGFTWENQHYVMEFKSWTQLSGAGKTPTFSNGEVYYKENGQSVRLPFTLDKDFASYNMPRNSYNIDKKGIEYVVNFGHVKSLQSSFSVDGAFYHITKIAQVLPFGEKKLISYLGQRFPYLPVYPGGDGDVLQRLNSNFQVITHIPALKMVTSVSAQMIWLDKSTSYWKGDNGKPVYYAKGANNQKIYGQTQGVDKVYVDPIAYYDKNMEYHQWQDNFTFETPYYFMVKEYKSNNFDTVGYPVLCQINVKLTKEIGSRAKLAFFANNVFNNKPLFKNPTTDYYLRRNQTAYFGAEFKFIL
jgi:hypothetical protein